MRLRNGIVLMGLTWALSTQANAAQLYAFCSTGGWFAQTKGTDFAAVSDCFLSTSVFGAAVSEAEAEGICQNNWASELGLFFKDPRATIGGTFRSLSECESQRNRVSAAYSARSRSTESFLIRDLRTTRYLK